MNNSKIDLDIEIDIDDSDVVPTVRFDTPAYHLKMEKQLYNEAYENSFSSWKKPDEAPITKRADCQAPITQRAIPVR